MPEIKFNVTEKAHNEIATAAKALGVSMDFYATMAILSNARSDYQKRLQRDLKKRSGLHCNAALNMNSL